MEGANEEELMYCVALDEGEQRSEPNDSELVDSKAQAREDGIEYDILIYAALGEGQGILEQFRLFYDPKKDARWPQLVTEETKLMKLRSGSLPHDKDTVYCAWMHSVSSTNPGANDPWKHSVKIRLHEAAEELKKANTPVDSPVIVSAEKLGIYQKKFKNGYDAKNFLLTLSKVEQVQHHFDAECGRKEDHTRRQTDADKCIQEQTDREPAREAQMK